MLHKIDDICFLFDFIPRRFYYFLRGIDFLLHIKTTIPSLDLLQRGNSEE